MNFDVEVGCLLVKNFEFNLKKAIAYGCVKDYVVSNHLLGKKYHIIGANDVFIQYIRDLIKR